jgi:hypothetical protein
MGVSVCPQAVQRDVPSVDPITRVIGNASPPLKGDLLFFFRKRDSQAEPLEDSIVEVAILHVLDERQGRLELDLYLRVWEALHPDARIEVLRED